MRSCFLTAVLIPSHLQSAGDTIGLWASLNLDDQCVMNNGDTYGWLQTWARISAGEF